MTDGWIMDIFGDGSDFDVRGCITCGNGPISDEATLCDKCAAFEIEMLQLFVRRLVTRADSFEVSTWAGFVATDYVITVGPFQMEVSESVGAAIQRALDNEDV